MMVSRKLRFLAAMAAAILSACSDDGDARVVQLSYEAIPGLGIELPGGSVDTTSSTYEDKLAFTQEVFAELVPAITAAVGIEIAETDSTIAPGGFLLATNPSMQTRLALAPGDEGDDDSAERVSAALGYVMYQWSVLVTEVSAEEGDTGYVVVRIAGGELTAERAQAFFVHAASVDEGLGGGYSAFGDEMLFLNIRGPDGVPYSGLDDAAFVSALEEAAEGFGEADAAVVESGTASARFVENDWESAPGGEQYAAAIGMDAVPMLDALREDFAARIDQAAMRYGWRTGDSQPLLPTRACGRMSSCLNAYLNVRRYAAQ